MRALNKLIPTLFLASMPCYSSDFFWSGFVSQGIVYNSDNQYFSDHDVSLDLTEAALQGGYVFSNNLRFAGQIQYRNWGHYDDINIDHLFLDYTIFTRPTSTAGIRLGRIKTELGIYNTSRDIPSARPTIFLPQSIYLEFMREPESYYDGGNLYGNMMLSIGTINWSVAYGMHSTSSDLVEKIFGGDLEGEFDPDFSHKLHLSWESPESDWLFGAGYQSVDIEFLTVPDPVISIDDGTFTLDKYTIFAQHYRERWEWTLELMYMDIGGDGFDTSIMGTPVPKLFSLDTGMDGGYFQARYFATDQITLLARYDVYFKDRDNRYNSTNANVVDYAQYSKDFTAGLMWQINKDWTLKTEAHFVEGAGFIAPMIRVNNKNIGDKYWQMYAAEISYSF